MLNAASKAAAIATQAKENFTESPKVWEAIAEWFEFRDRFKNPDTDLLERLKFLADRAQARAQSSIEEDERFEAEYGRHGDDD